MTGPRPTTQSQWDDRGAALITMLLVVAVMGGIVTALLGQIRSGVTSALWRQEASQATWHLLSAEVAARDLLFRQREKSPLKTSLDQPWARQPVEIAMGDGLIQARIEDASHCINVNSLAHPDAESPKPHQTQAQLSRLMTALLISEDLADVLLAELTDFLDADHRPTPRGREDFDYMRSAPHHRAANGTIVHISDMKTLYSMTPALYQTLSPYLCARPSHDIVPININTLPIEKSPLLQAVMPGLTRSMATKALAERPGAGWPSVQDFLLTKAFDQKTWASEIQDLLSIKANYFTLHTQFIMKDGRRPMESLIKFDEAGNPAVVRHEIGVVE